LFLNIFRQKELKAVWRLEKNGRRSFLVGTAHFFPYSFKASTTKLLKQVNKVLFEGPLDEISMSKVVDAGLQGDRSDCILDELDEATVAKIAKILAPADSSGSVAANLEMFFTAPDVSIRAMIEGMKPWMAFFSIYSRFVQNQGWKYSVDMEAFHLGEKMGKNIIPLETIEEQIEVLETVSRPQIIDFLKRIDQWHSYTRDFVKWYLDGDLEAIHSNSYRFPTRSQAVIEDRDKVFYHRMVPHLEQGDAAAFVGIPHVMGINRLLSADGYEIRQVQS
jgi:uncharacterized protein YbaP (TraB family)